MQETRRHRRLEGPVLVEYRCLEGAKLAGRSNAFNISEGGIRFPITARVAVGTPVELHLHVGRVGVSPAMVQGRVVWVEHTQDVSEQPYTVGVAFTEPSTKTMQRLLARVYAHWRHVMHPDEESS